MKKLLVALNNTFGRLFGRGESKEDSIITAYKRKVPVDYQLAIRRLATSHTNRRFLNDGDADNYTKFVGELMVGCALEEEDIVIYSHLMTPSLVAITTNSRRCFRIILDKHEDCETVPVSEGLRSRVEIRYTFTPGKIHHMFVAGDSFRYETGHSKVFVCNFHEPDVAARLRAQFETLWCSLPIAGASV